LEHNKSPRCPSPATSESNPSLSPPPFTPSHRRERILFQVYCSGVSLPRSVTPDLVPEWILSMLSLITSHNICDHLMWQGLVNCWLWIESANGYDIGTPLRDIPDTFPHTAIGWFNRRRAVNWRPNTDKYGSPQEQVRAVHRYWHDLQPNWRIQRDGTISGWYVPYPTDDVWQGDYSVFHFGGIDGWPNIIVPLFFAAGEFWEGNGFPEFSDEWHACVSDISWVLHWVMFEKMHPQAAYRRG
jgi:hypothetical protein